ncbi:MAG TPA: PPK2 family polyphosphate kinase, partial [Nitriliruptorales bacterium]
GGLNPQGAHVASFKQPSDNELDRDYLWRVHHQVPRRGEIGIFNRSHYEDVGVVRVLELVPAQVWQRRLRHIREFEGMLVDEGTAIVKVWLHISKDEQKERLQARLREPDKRWKFDRGDLAMRQRWDDFQIAYDHAISQTSTAGAPWYVVPADRKWVRDVAVASILVETLERMDPAYPEPSDDLDGIVIP